MTADGTTRPDPFGFPELARWEAAVGRVRFALAVAAAVQLASVVLYSHNFSEGATPRLRETYAVLCRGPFTHAVVDTPQARHRILGPLIAYSIGLRGMSGQAVLVVAGYAFLVFFYLFVRRRWDCESSVLLTALIATTPVVMTAHAWPGYPDILAHLAVLAAMTVRSPWLAGPILLVGMLGDERAIAAAPLAALWHVAVKTDARPVRGFLIRGTTSAAALGLWLGFYRWVQAEYVEPIPDYNNDQFLHQHLSGQLATLGLFNLPGGAYYALRAAWLFPILFAVRCPDPSRRWLGPAVAAATALAALPGVIVIDHSRCIAMCWPVVLIAADRVRDHVPNAFRALAYAALMLNVFTPMYDVYSVEFILRLPLPAALAYYFMGA